MADLIRFKRGLEAELTTPLAIGEPGFTTDGERIYIGGINGNVPIPKKSEIDSITSDLANMTTQVLPLKADKIYVDTNKRDKASEISMLDLAQDVKTAMTGGSVAVVAPNIVSTVNIKDNKVTSEKVDFLTTLGNIFNKDADKILNGYYNIAGGWNTQVLNITILVHVKPNTTYANNLVKNTLVFFDGNMGFISGIANGTWTNLVVPNNSNIYYVAITFNVNEILANMMIVEGTTLPSVYVPYKFTLGNNVNLNANQKLEFITDAQVTTKVISKNFFNKANIIIGKEVYGDGTFNTYATSACSGFIEIPQNDGGLYISGLPFYSVGSGKACNFYDSSKVLISNNTIDIGILEKYYNIPVNAKCLAFTIYGRKTSAEVMDLTKIQVELGVTKTAYVDYQLGVSEIKSMPFISDNSAVATVELKTKDKTMLIFGDSITETATVSDDGATYTEGTRINWATFSKINLKLNTIWNYAKSGACYTEFSYITELRQKIYTQISTAIANNRVGDIVVVSAGTNDAGNMNATYLDDYVTAMAKTTLVDLDRTKFYQALRWAFWTLQLNYPNAIFFCTTPIQQAHMDIPSTITDAIKAMAKRYNFVIIDLNTESGIVRDFEIEGSSGRYLIDGLHPKANGQEKISNCINSRILNYLNNAN